MSRPLDNPTGLTLATAVRLAYAAATRVRDDVMAARLTPATALLAAAAADVAQQALAAVQTPAGRGWITGRMQRALQAAANLQTALQDAAPLLRTGAPLTDAQQRPLLTAALALRIQLQGCDVDVSATACPPDRCLAALEAQHA